MRPGQNRRMRGRTRSKGPNPLTKTYESNGPDVKIRGTAQHVADKYAQLARDSQASGDPVAAENYFQHAEHYYRMIAAVQEQYRQQFGTQRPFEDDEDSDEDGGGYGQSERTSGGQQGLDDYGDPGPHHQQAFESRQDGERSNRFDRGERFDSPDRGDRTERSNGPDRGNRPERSNAPDRGERFERSNGPDRGDRPERGNGPDRGDRPERGNNPDRGDRAERGNNLDRGDRPERSNNPDRANGPDRNERFDRNDRGNRPERFDRNDRRDRLPRNDRPQRQDLPRADAPRPESTREDQQSPRPEFNRDGDRRRDRDDAGPSRDQPAGLPAFLTNPVRPVIAVDDPDSAAPATLEPPTEGGGPGEDVNGAEANGARFGARPRRRRRPRFEGGEGGSEGGADLGPEGSDTPVGE